MKPIVIIAIAVVCVIGIGGIIMGSFGSNDAKSNTDSKTIEPETIEPETIEDCKSIHGEDNFKVVMCMNNFNKKNTLQSFYAYRANQGVLSPSPSDVGFSNTVCEKGLLGEVQMSGSFTNGNVAHTSIWLTLLVRDFNGNIVATGSTEIKDIERFEKQHFVAKATWDAPFSDCIIEINDPQVEEELINLINQEEKNPYNVCRYARVADNSVDMNTINDCMSDPQNLNYDWGRFMKYSLDCDKGWEYYVERMTIDREYREWYYQNYFYLSPESLRELIILSYEKNGFCSDYNLP